MSAAVASLDLRKAVVKVFAAPGPVPDLRPFIPVFHRWIAGHKLDGILVDVAEYTHVANGPGVLLVAHEGQWVLDAEDGKLGMVYSQRRPPEGTPAEHLRRALRECLKACALLEQESEAKGKITLTPNHLSICVNDRLATPNAPATYAALEPVVREVLSPLYSDLKLTPEPDPRKRAGIQITVASAPSISEILSRANSP
ncbi:MAG: hypothetical protein AAB368_08890 [bacterium]